jgi:cyclic pyranopterin phosphate synthase
VALSLAQVDFSFEKASVRVESLVKTTGPTGVELEALAAVWGALLTIYDMVKAVEKGATLTDITLLEKEGGRSGHYRRKG